ncbi:hypothetical protein [Sulfurifustis variabilis]|uniref:hypothetical protein n=1 Tax=Sulfurifustis variabilis TaxID=1675686 RepID=UPI0011E4D09F|nr:hypothetical protein [Sulfurifustis variabilis]
MSVRDRVRLLSAAEKEVFREATGRDAPGCVVQRWPWWWRDFRGLALGTVILVKDDSDRALVCHEAVHVAQFLADPVRFWFRYVAELARAGYVRNRYEREAAAVEAAARDIVTPPPGRS